MNMAELGAHIRSRRKQVRLNQQQLADEAGVGLVFVSQIENGKETAHVGLVLKLLEALGLDVVVKERP
jgi:HTH-type transcriptional regulator/antitoxin HipB